MTGPCFQREDTVMCTFHDKSSVGMYISEDQVLCVSPLLEDVGLVEFMLTIESSDESSKSFKSDYLTGRSIFL